MAAVSSMLVRRISADCLCRGNIVLPFFDASGLYSRWLSTLPQTDILRSTQRTRHRNLDQRLAPRLQYIPSHTSRAGSMTIQDIPAFSADQRATTDPASSLQASLLRHPARTQHESRSCGARERQQATSGRAARRDGTSGCKAGAGAKRSRKVINVYPEPGSDEIGSTAWRTLQQQARSLHGFCLLHQCW